MFKHLWVLALLGALAVLGCGQADSGPSEVGTNPSTGLDTMAEVILDTPIIAHVSVTSVTMSAAPWREGDGPEMWVPALEITFKVLEYLKGTGDKSVVAYVRAYEPFDNRADAENQTWLMEAFDDRWNDREAVVFLDDWGPYIPLPDDRLYLGGIVEPGSDNFSITSHESRKWLPAAPTSSGVRSTTDSDPAFLLSAPTAQTGARSTAARSADSSMPTIRLSALKAKINTLEADANAGGGMYRNCLIWSAENERVERMMFAIRGPVTNTTDVEMTSGQPAGTDIHEGYLASGLPPDKIGRHWFEGDDPHIVTTTVSNIRTEPPLNTRNYVELILKYTTHLRTTRPLPAGSYQFFHNHQHPFNAVCDGYNDRNYYSYELTVTPPPRVLLEAFFDPVAIGSAVGADGSNGVLEPAAFGDVTISSLKWESGAVSMTLNPTASLADYAVDFIDVTGTTTLSLTSDNASTTALAWTVPDKPWSDGDLLMLRIHKPISTDATLSALAVSGVDLTFDPATTTYTASVPATTTQTTVTPTTNHASATYVVKLDGVVDADGTIPLAAGDNVITIDVTAEDATTTKTYTVTITRATPAAPVTVTLIPRVNGLTFFDIDIQWSHSGTCDNYYVAIITDANYQISFLGFHPPETSSHYVEGSWLYNNVPDFWVVVECRTSGQTQEVGRASLRAAHPDNN